jgi:hypothetical protein
VHPPDADIQHASCSVVRCEHLSIAGMALGILMNKGARVIRKVQEQTSGPYRYLSNVAKAADLRQSVLSIAPPR